MSVFKKASHPSSLGRWRVVIALSATLLVGRESASQTSTVLVQEPFEDASFLSRGWYDSTGGALSTTEKFAGTRSMECRFAVGGTGCANGTPARHLFAETDSIYFSYYIKHTSNWVGSGRSYHPHMFMFLTNMNDMYSGLAYTYLTAYIEENGGFPEFLIQDGQNIDETRIGSDLTNVTEQRSVAGCNGDSDGHGNGDCYVAGTGHWNGKMWKTAQVYFGNTPGTPTYKGDWHLVEAYFKMNGIVGGKAAKNGIIRYWFDGNLVMEHLNIVMRTGARASMRFNQLAFVPYIGDGSPVAQSFWVDNLMIATARPAVPPPPPGGAPTAPAPPANLRVVP